MIDELIFSVGDSRVKKKTRQRGVFTSLKLRCNNRHN